MRLLQSLLLLSFLPITAFAQTLEEITTLRTAATPLSVRSAALGAVSEDDPSANPAALSSLRKPLYSASVARTSYEITQILGIDNTFYFDVPHNLSSTNLTHALVAFPLRNDVVLSAYYRRDPDLRGVMPFGAAGTDAYLKTNDIIYAVAGGFMMQPALERRDVRYGVSGSWERGNLAIGAGAELQELDERVSLLGFRSITTVDQVGWRERRTLHTKGRELVPNVGLRWRATPHVTFGAAYNGAASFERTEDGCIVTGAPWSDCATVYERIDTDRVRTADAIRASVAIDAGERVRLVGEAVRRNYSNQTDSFFHPLQDVTELHAGAEYRVSGVALRAGWWRDPAHFDDALWHFSPMAKTVDHVTFGAGIDVGRTRVDVAYDNAEVPALRRASIGVTFSVE